jgi:hypothetical protein
MHFNKRVTFVCTGPLTGMALHRKHIVLIRRETMLLLLDRKEKVVQEESLEAGFFSLLDRSFYSLTSIALILGAGGG